LAEFGEQAADAGGNALVTVDFTVPAVLAGVLGQLLEAVAFAKTRRVLGDW
jgi:hypothetical protein